jgi:hypothetical protein
MNTQRTKRGRAKKARKPKRQQFIGPLLRNGARSKNQPNKRRKQNLRREIQLGPLVARAAGNFIANGINTLIKGFGDYKVAGNTVMGLGAGVPMFANSNGKFIFQRQEYLRDINSAILFTILSFNLNPGIKATFPWLSQIARSFEQYKIHGLVFYFRSLSSPNVLSSSPNTALGSVVLCTQYDPKDDPFTSKFEMENYVYSSSGPPYKDQLHPVECKKSTAVLEELLIRTPEEVPQSDLSFYDFGVFSLVVVGCPSADGVIGELWISYEIELLKPKISNFILVNPTDSWTLVAPTALLPLGASRVNITNELLGTIVSLTYSNAFGVIGNNYLLVYTVVGTAASVVAPVLTGAAATFTSFFGAPTLSNNGITTVLIAVTVFEITASSFSITFGTAGTLPNPVTSSKLLICPVSPLVSPMLTNMVNFENRLDCLELLLRDLNIDTTPLHETN